MDGAGEVVCAREGSAAESNRARIQGMLLLFISSLHWHYCALSVSVRNGRNGRLALFSIEINGFAAHA